MDFQSAVAHLYGLGNEVSAMKLGLESMRSLLAELGNPQEKFRKLQVAGTNGKGSVCTFLDAICSASGIRTGLYTSPHLISVTERIKIDGVDLSEDDFARLATIVREAGERIAAGSGGERTVPTFFEQVTAIAALAFAEAEVELAILETGLGGRLDATTALDAEIAVITRVDLDHQEWLGNTIPKIAAEKAAIIREGSKAVIGFQKPEAMQVILRRCEETGVEPVTVDLLERASGASKSPFGGDSIALRTATRDYRIDALGLIGAHQIENAIAAVLAAECLAESGFEGVNETSIGSGLRSARHPGRLELVDGVLLDGAHNLSGAEALRRFLGRVAGTPVTMVFGAMREKDVEKIGRILFPAAHRVVAVTAENTRAMPADEIAEIARGIIGDGKVTASGTLLEALESAREVTHEKGLICVTGSLYLVGEARKLLIGG